jgi:hypothetical protein
MKIENLWHSIHFIFAAVMKKTKSQQYEEVNTKIIGRN